MQITKDFLVDEIAHLEQERRKAYEFTIKATATIEAYRMLCAKLDEPEPAPENPITDSQQ